MPAWSDKRRSPLATRRARQVQRPSPGARAPDRHRDHSLPFARSRSNAGKAEQVLETLGDAKNAIAHEVLDLTDVLQFVETDLLENGSASVRPRMLHDAVGQPRTLILRAA